MHTPTRVYTQARTQLSEGAFTSILILYEYTYKLYFSLINCTYHSTAASRESSKPPLVLERTFRHVSILFSSNPMSLRVEESPLLSVELEVILISLLCVFLNSAHYHRNAKRKDYPAALSHVTRWIIG